MNDVVGWVVWAVAIAAGVFVLVWALLAVRRRLFDHPDSSEPAFTLDQLRTLRRQGVLSDDEYEILRQRLLDKHRV